MRVDWWTRWNLFTSGFRINLYALRFRNPRNGSGGSLATQSALTHAWKLQTDRLDQLAMMPDNDSSSLLTVNEMQTIFTVADGNFLNDTREREREEAIRETKRTGNCSVHVMHVATIATTERSFSVTRGEA